MWSDSSEGRSNITTFGSILVNNWIKDLPRLFSYFYVEIVSTVSIWTPNDSPFCYSFCEPPAPRDDCFKNTVVVSICQVKVATLHPTEVRWRHHHPLPDNHPQHPPPCRPAPAAVTSVSRQVAPLEDFRFRFQKKTRVEVIAALRLRFCVRDPACIGQRVIFKFNVLESFSMKL